MKSVVNHLRADAAALLMLGGLQAAVPAHAEVATPAELHKFDTTNVIVISIDTLRNDHLGCYGYPRNTSENIDRFAKRGVLFENFITQAALTPISQMSIFTSQHPRTNGMASYEASAGAVTARTLPTILKYYGYTNVAFVSSPEFYQTLNSSDSFISNNHEKLFGKSFDTFKLSDFRAIPEESLQWIRANKEKKFFMWIPIGTVHWPYSDQVPPPFKTMYDPPSYTPFFLRSRPVGAQEQSDSISHDLLFHIYKNVYYADPAPPYPLSNTDIQFITSRYDAGISYTDLFVGQLLALLDALKLDENTLVVLHSIHGEDLGEHGYFYHYDIYDTEVKNALIMRFPGNAFSGKKVSTQAQGIDIVPTLLDYLGIPANHEAQGNSLMDVIRTGQDPGFNEFVYTTRTPLWEYTMYRGQRLVRMARRKGTSPRERDKLLEYKNILRQYLEKYDPLDPPHDIAIRTNKWKLILRKDVSLLEKISLWSFVSGKKIAIDEVELYDLANDPFEQMNIASERPDIAGTLKRRLLDWDAAIEKLKPKSDTGRERFMIPYPNER